MRRCLVSRLDQRTSKKIASHNYCSLRSLNCYNLSGNGKICSRLTYVQAAMANRTMLLTPGKESEPTPVAMWAAAPAAGITTAPALQSKQGLHQQLGFSRDRKCA